METERFTITKKAGIYGMIGNILLLILKGMVGFLTHSQAMIADAFNSAGDIFASLMTFIGNKIASEPNDEDHNFGHGKAEYLFSMFIGISMILVASKLLYDSAMTFIIGSDLQFSWSLLFVCAVTIITKFSLFLYTKHSYQLHKNILLEANMKDHRNDCIVTSFTLLSSISTLFHVFWLDSIVGFGISIWICYTGITIFMESYRVLMDISVDEKTKDVILNLARVYPEIKSIQNFSSSPVGAKYTIFLTICVDGNMSTFESHKLADDLEKTVSTLDIVYKTIVHVEPV